MEAKDIMSRNIVCTHAMESVFDAAELMLGANVSALVVVNDRREVIGILSEADLIRRAESGTTSTKSWLARIIENDSTAARELVATHTRRVSDIMTKEVMTAGEHTSLPELVVRMQRHHVKRLPIVRDGVLVGVVSRADLVRAVLSREPRCPDLRPDDKALRESVIKVLNDHAGTSRAPISVVMDEGVAHLWGSVESPEVRDACRVAAAGVPGVRRVNSHIRLALAPVLTCG